jgi:5'-3' exonuclease
MEDFVIIKQLLDLLQVPHYYAVSEAEATCAHLCLNGQVDAVMTEDTDILAYGCPFNLHKINVHTNTIMLIEMKSLLNMLNFSYPQFRDFCIMCGTDYNTNIPKIGPERAYRYLRDYKSIEHLSTFLDVSVLKHLDVRRLFSNDITFEIPKHTYCGYPNSKELSLFYFTNNCHFDMHRLVKAFEEPRHPFLFLDTVTQSSSSMVK